MLKMRTLDFARVLQQILHFAAYDVKIMVEQIEEEKEGPIENAFLTPFLNFSVQPKSYLMIVKLKTSRRKIIRIKKVDSKTRALLIDTKYEL